MNIRLCRVNLIGLIFILVVDLLIHDEETGAIMV